VAGDKLGILPTGFAYKESDYVNVEAYDIETGIVTLDRELINYHWG